METLKKLAITAILVLLCFAGCDNLVQNEAIETDSIEKSNNQFLFSQDYGYCNDTICIGESVILKDTVIYNENKCYVFEVYTGDTLYNGIYLSGFNLSVNLIDNFSMNFGNGQSKIFSGSENFKIKWFCNRTYEVIICNEK